MTSSYLVLTAPGGTDTNHEKTRFIRDGFTVLGFLFPWIWLAFHRLWLYAVAAFLLQTLGGALTDRADLWPVGLAITFSTSLLVALEGQNLRIRDLVAKGWDETDLVSADSLPTAEEIYFSNVPTDTGDSRPAPSPQWDPTAHAPRHGNATSLGLFGFDGGR
ncbi:hypothetical protein ATY81_07375 [Rhizobium sp. R72]|uniref:DUF2628 domain-containing protein n=1 Tax=unclassified Rhizobium TaxID=2613769 RepID=UPI000B538417|nr:MULTISPECIES: DUF2628 domain-containing protein [unclassified Rhizobium]OWV91132.1 hypothetical protein ATY79_07005 [Rhizobium sp. R693]OWW01048.1 hypothetical protein ATY81_07375 [Rhizobium sp. R72]OWW01427.1 hypothetical protein ATY80_07375 [Rhizobium sp. R711]